VLNEVERWPDGLPGYCVESVRTRLPLSSHGKQIGVLRDGRRNADAVAGSDSTCDHRFAAVEFSSNPGRESE
jgi:hypothetical protein